MFDFLQIASRQRVGNLAWPDGPRHADATSLSAGCPWAASSLAQAHASSRTVRLTIRWAVPGTTLKGN